MSNDLNLKETHVAACNLYPTTNVNTKYNQGKQENAL